MIWDGIAIVPTPLPDFHLREGHVSSKVNGISTTSVGEPNFVL